jgi:hypothetical protein
VIGSNYVYVTIQKSHAFLNITKLSQYIWLYSVQQEDECEWTIWTVRKKDYGIHFNYWSRTSRTRTRMQTIQYWRSEIKREVKTIRRLLTYGLLKVAPSKSRLCTHSLNYAADIFPKIRCKSNFAQVGFGCTYGHLYTCTQGSLVEIQTPTYSKLTGRSITALLRVIAQQHSPATFVSLRFQIRKENFGMHFRTIITTFYALKKLRRPQIG